jgi:uncharacterized OB-fold protein
MLDFVGVRCMQCTQVVIPDRMLRCHGNGDRTDVQVL